MIHTPRVAEDSDSRVVWLVTRRVFIEEGLVFLDDFEQIILSLQRNPGKREELAWLAGSMIDFRDGAQRHNLAEISHLAEEVARVFEKAHNGSGRLSHHTLNLVQAALSQLRLMLAPSLNGAGENALRIMTGLIRGL